MSRAAHAILAPSLRNRRDCLAAAGYLGVSHQTLAEWRMKGLYSEILRPFRLGRKIWYPQDGLDQFIASRMTGSASR